MKNIHIPICDVFRGKIISNIIESLTSSIKANTNMMHPCPFKVKWTKAEIRPNDSIKYNSIFPNTCRTISMREIFLYTYHSCQTLRPAAIIWCKLLLCESEEERRISLDKSKCILTFLMNKITSVSTLNKIISFKYIYMGFYLQKCRKDTRRIRLVNNIQVKLFVIKYYHHMRIN